MKIILTLLVLCATIAYAQRDYPSRDYHRTQFFSKKICKRNDIEVEVNKSIKRNNPCAKYTCFPNYTLRETYCANPNPRSRLPFPRCCRN